MSLQRQLLIADEPAALLVDPDAGRKVVQEQYAYHHAAMEHGIAGGMSGRWFPDR